MNQEAAHTGHVLAESEIPFWFVNYDYKEMIKHRAHNGHDVAHP